LIVANPKREMSMKVQITPWQVIVASYLVGFGVLTGLMIDHLVFDRQRSAVLHRYEHALKEWHAQHMLIEKAAQHPSAD
jgi:hypothetical protein